MQLEKAEKIIEENNQMHKMVCSCNRLGICHRCVIEMSLPEEIVEEAEKVVTIYELVRKTLSSFPSVKIEDINKDTNLKYDLDINGFDVFFLLQHIEIECDVNLTTVSEFVNQITVEDIVNSIFQKMKKQKEEKDV